MRRGEVADHSHPLTPLKSIPLQVAPMGNQAFKSEKIRSWLKHSNMSLDMQFIVNESSINEWEADLNDWKMKFVRIMIFINTLPRRQIYMARSFK